MAITAPEVAPEPIPSVRLASPTTPESFGGGAGLEQVNQAVQKTAADVGEIATFEKIRADQTATTESLGVLSNKYNDLVTNPQTGVLASRGVNAISSQDQAAADFKKTANDLAGQLNGPTQKGPFNAKAQEMYQQFIKQTNGHVMQQLDEHQEASYKSFVQNETSRGAIAYGDPESNKQILQGIVNSTDAHANLMGFDANQAETAKMAVTSNYHEQTIDQMLRDPRMIPTAKQYFADNKEQIDLKTRDRIEGAIGEGSTRYQAQSAVQDILRSAPDSEADALKQADKIDDADTREMTRKLISTRFQQDRQAKKNDQDNTFTDWGQKIAKMGITDPVDIRNSVPPSIWNSMRGDQQTALLKSQQESVTSPKKWLDFMESVKDGSVTQMPRAELEEKYLPYMDAGDKKQAEDLWTTGRKGPGSAKLSNDQSVLRSIDTSLVNSGLIHADSKRRSDNDKKLQYQFQADVHSDILGFEASSKKSPSPQDIQNIVDTRTRQYFADHLVKVQSGSAFIPNSQKPISILTDAQKNQTYVPYGKIPPKDATTLETLMRQNNKPVSNDKVQRAYAAYLGGDKKRLREIVNE